MPKLVGGVGGGRLAPLTKRVDGGLPVKAAQERVRMINRILLAPANASLPMAATVAQQVFHNAKSY